MRMQSRKTRTTRPLKMAIWDSGKTQRELSIAARIGETRFSKIVRGHELATDDEKRAIAKALRVTVATIFPDSTEAAVA